MTKLTCRCTAALFVGFIAVNAIAENGPATAADLIELDFEELVNMDVEIGSAGKQSSRAMDLPYAAFVLSSEEIRNAGVQNIPDALRLIPGISVGQISANEWSISIRGSGGRYSRFVLVMVDGRIAYNTVFAGVNWDELNYLMEAIERIEVVRGPNAAAWGANAVNGIIHIITHQPTQTAPTKISAWSGDNRQGASLEMAQRLPGNWTLGVNAHGNQWQGLQPENGDREDNPHNWRLGLNLGQSDDDRRSTRFTLDAFASDLSPPVSWVSEDMLADVSAPSDETKTGWAMVGEQLHQFNNHFKLRLRAAADHATRNAHIYDWESSNHQADIELGISRGRHQISTGFNYRVNDSNIVAQSTFKVRLSPEKSQVQQYGVFISDVIRLTEHLQTTLSVRWDDNELIQANTQPSMRLLWQPSDADSIWFAMSEASATPSRAIVDIIDSPYRFIPAAYPQQPLPVILEVQGYEQGRADTKVTALEAGWRKTFQRFNIDIAFFDFNYSNEVSFLPVGEPQLQFNPNGIPTHLIQPLLFSNRRDFSSRGGEFSTRAQLAHWWQAQLSYSRISLLDNLGPWSSNFVFSNQIGIKSNLQLNINFRHSHGNASITAQYPELIAISSSIDNYFVADIHLNWQPSNKWNISLIANNLVNTHLEAAREEFFTPVNIVEPYGIIKLGYRF